VRDLGLEALVLAPPHIGELDAIRADCRLGVEEDGNAEAAGEPLPVDEPETATPDAGV